KVDRAGEFPASRQSFGPFEGAGAVNVTYDRNETIFYDGDDAEYCFRVLSGMVRLCKITEDGRRQISAFLAPGDVFGWTLYPCHSFSAEAVTDVVVQKCRRARVEETIRANPAAGR